MPHFLLQKDEDGFLQELPNAVRNSCGFQNWRRGREEHTWEAYDSLVALPREVLMEGVPIAPLETCEAILNILYPRAKLPVFGIPPMLEPYAHRQLWHGDSREVERLLTKHRRLFVKEEGRYKGFTDMVDERTPIPAGKQFLISEVVDFKAEWRIFFNLGRIVSAKPYILEDWLMPNKAEIEEMLNIWKEKSPSGTIDIAIDKNGKQHLLECHPFISVGLYGLDEADVADMAYRSWNWVLKNAKSPLR